MTWVGLRRSAASLSAIGWFVGCGLSHPPVTPDPALLGCYRLDTEPLAAYADSLGYELPELVRLGYSKHGQWTVVPTDPDWHPTWTIYDRLPSGFVRRELGFRSTPRSQWDSIARIQGDSIDISFPSWLGQLTVRLGPGQEAWGGRAEWVVNWRTYFLNEGVRVSARPAPCDDLKLALRRTR